MPVSASPQTAASSVAPAKTMPAPAVPAVRPTASGTEKPPRSRLRWRMTRNSA